MKRSEYRDIYYAFNNYLEKSEQQYIREDLLYENLVLNESLQSFAKKVGREGIFYLAAITAINAFGLDAAANKLNVPKTELAQIANEASGENNTPQDTVDAATKAAQENPGKILALKQQIENMSTERAYNEILTLDDFDFNKKNSEEFNKILDKEIEFVAAKKGDAFEHMNGVFIKETFKASDQNKKIVDEIIKKAKEIHDYSQIDRVFDIKVNNFKYAVVVHSSFDEKSNVSLMNRYATNITNSLMDAVVPNLTESDENAEDAFEQCKISLHNHIHNKTFKHLLTQKTPRFASFISKKAFAEGFYRCFGKKLEEVKTKIINYMPSVSLNSTKYAGIVTLESNFFQSMSIFFGNRSLKEVSPEQMSSMFIHELGHLVSDQSGQDTIAKYQMQNFFENMNKVRFTLRDVAEFIVIENLINLGFEREEIDSFEILKKLNKEALQLVIITAKKFLGQMVSIGVLYEYAGKNDLTGKEETYYDVLIDKKNSDSLYFGNPEERIENLRTWILSLDGDNKLDTAEKILNDLVAYTGPKNSEFAKEIMDDVSYDREDNKDLSIERLTKNYERGSARNNIDYFLIQKVYKKYKIRNRSEHWRLMKLINLDGFSRNGELLNIKILCPKGYINIGHWITHKSIKGLKDLMQNFDENVNHDHHDHDHD